jgi:uncharacterized membrane protein YdbT with pleckstrin-like domain
LQSELALRSNVTKSLIKGTIAIGVLSVFLEINPSTYGKYLIFVAIYYSLLAAYMFFKESTVYTIDESGIRIRRPFRKEIGVTFENVGNMSYAQGMLARRFRCGTVYVELKKGKGTHTATTGQGLYVLKDVPNPIDVYQELLDRVGLFVPTPEETGPPAPA